MVPVQTVKYNSPFVVEIKGRWIIAVFGAFNDSARVEFGGHQSKKAVFVAALVLDRTDGNIVLYAQCADRRFGDYRVHPYRKENFRAVSGDVNKAEQVLRQFYEEKIYRFQPLARIKPDTLHVRTSYEFHC